MLNQLQIDIFHAAIIGTQSTSHEWKTAPCQYLEIMNMISKPEYGHAERIAIFTSFNENRKLQLDAELLLT
jgi:hypothetical protein